MIFIPDIQSILIFKINIIHHINTEKEFGNSSSVHEKNSHKYKNRVGLPQFDKEHLFKNLMQTLCLIIKLNAFPLRSDTRPCLWFSPFLMNTVLEVLAKIMSKQNKIKNLYIRKLEIKFPIFR